MTQAQQRDGNTTLRRWYVTVLRSSHQTIVTWAETAERARAKAEGRGLVVVSVVPAVSRIDETSRR